MSLPCAVIAETAVHMRIEKSRIVREEERKCEIDGWNCEESVDAR